MRLYQPDSGSESILFPAAHRSAATVFSTDDLIFALSPEGGILDFV
jgi:hypothetical protein